MPSPSTFSAATPPIVPPLDSTCAQSEATAAMRSEADGDGDGEVEAHARGGGARSGRQSVVCVTHTRARPLKCACATPAQRMNTDVVRGDRSIGLQNVNVYDPPKYPGSGYLLRLLFVAASPRPLPWPVRTFATLRPAKVRHDAALHSARETRNASIWYAPRHVSFHVLPWATRCSTLYVRLAVQFQRIAGRRAGLSVHQVCGDDDGGSFPGHP